MRILNLIGFAIIGFVLLNCSPYKNLTKMEFEDLEYPYPVKTATVNENIKIAYIDEGAGDQTIIFIHGLGSYLRAWEKNIPALKEKYRCIAIDLPGYGKSDKGIYPYSMDFFADVIKEFTEELNIKNAVIAGHSLGGQIAISTALKYPEIVSKLILVDPAGFERFTEGQKQWFRDVMTVKFVKFTSPNQIRKNVVINFYDMPDDAEFMITDRIALRGAKDFDKYCYAVVESVSAMVDAPVYNLLEKIKQPTLIVFGKNDELIPNRFLNPGFTEDIAKEGTSKIPNAKLVLFEKCGHFSQFEKADEFNYEVEIFLK
ncbi:MAG: alpha/beta hydrolase [Chlorobi bacterium]|nr:alpha/beta hydrolase [Chlorobiota bacterium]